MPVPGRGHPSARLSLRRSVLATNRVRRAKPPAEVIAGSVLATVGGVAGLIAGLLALMTTDPRDEAEAMAAVGAALLLIPAAFTSILFTGLAAIVFAAGKARRPAAALATVMVLSIAAFSWWWLDHS